MPANPRAPSIENLTFLRAAEGTFLDSPESIQEAHVEKLSLGSPPLSCGTPTFRYSVKDEGSGVPGSREDIRECLGNCIEAVQRTPQRRRIFSTR